MTRQATTFAPGPGHPGQAGEQVTPVATDDNQRMPEPDSPRKRELLEAAYRYVLGNGLADMSLRPLAREIGSSPRVLLFLFGSKEGLIRALLARARVDELTYLADLRDLRKEHDAGREVWAWLAAPAHRALLALWVEGYARSLLGDPGPWAGFGRDTVNDWLELLAKRQPAHRRDTPQAKAERTLLLAVLRGALLDLLATGDTGRVTAAVECYLQAPSTSNHQSDRTERRGAIDGKRYTGRDQR
jgi:AcrR family transcriptional regulator